MVHCVVTGGRVPVDQWPREQKARFVKKRAWRREEMIQSASRQVRENAPHE